MNYPMSDVMRRRLDNDFTYHSPTEDQPERYEYIRAQAKKLAHDIIEKTPPSREQSLALTKLEEVVFWANASIARNEGEQENEIRIEECSVGNVTITRTYGNGK